MLLKLKTEQMPSTCGAANVPFVRVGDRFDGFLNFSQSKYPKADSEEVGPAGWKTLEYNQPCIDSIGREEHTAGSGERIHRQWTLPPDGGLAILQPNPEAKMR
jgi:hypothetical protein